MSKKLFSDEEIKLLLTNRYVKTISTSAITYTDEFKILFIAKRSKGKIPIYIFQDAGFDVSVIGKRRIWCASKRWRNNYSASGELGLRDLRKLNSGRPIKRELTFGHMKDEINYKSCVTFQELEIVIDEYMDYYNNYRYQWRLKKLVPVQYRNQLIAA